MKTVLLAAASWRPLAILLAGAGAAVTIYLLLRLHGWTGMAWLIPSFGASCALVFGVPDSPFAKPFSVIAGHLVASAMGLGTMAVLGHGPLAMAAGVGLGIAAMMATRTMHPPAGGDPLIVIATSATPSFLLMPVLLGTLLISLAGLGFARARRATQPRQRSSPR
jgi:CBS-domain-containing membrane protein